MKPETRITLNEQLDAMWRTINQDGTTYDETAAEIDRLKMAVDVAESIAEDHERDAIRWKDRYIEADGRANNLFNAFLAMGFTGKEINQIERGKAETVFERRRTIHQVNAPKANWIKEV